MRQNKRVLPIIYLLYCTKLIVAYSFHDKNITVKKCKVIPELNFHPWRNSPWYPLRRRLGGPQSQSGF
jgi:hypothetical protein